MLEFIFSRYKNLDLNIGTYNMESLTIENILF